MTAKHASTNADDVVILIPAYNEGTVIKDTIDEIPDCFTHIVCVDDGSQDNTKEQALQTRAEVVCHPLNMGQGASLQTAIEYALLDEGYKYFVTYDADGQHNFDDVERMLRIIREQKVDIVLGSRFLGQAVNITISKKLLLKLAVRFSNASSGIKLTDTHNGLRVFNRHTAEVLQLQSPDYTHASEIIERIAEKRLRYVEVPVTINYTEYSRSKGGQSMVNAVNISFDVLLNRLARR